MQASQSRCAELKRSVHEGATYVLRQARPISRHVACGLPPMRRIGLEHCWLVLHMQVLQQTRSRAARALPLQARQLLEEMSRAGVPPDLELYSAALRAAAAASDARSAEKVYAAMTAAGIKPDASAGGSLLAALRKGGSGSKAAQFAERFRREGLRITAADSRASNGGR